MSRLTKREKTMLYVLFLVIVAAIGWFLISSAIDKSLALDDTISEIEMQKSSFEQALATRPIYVRSIADASERIEVLSGEFLPLMTNDELDCMITDLLQRNGLVPESMHILDITEEIENTSTVKLSVKVKATGEYKAFLSFVEELSMLNGMRLTQFVIQQRNMVNKLVPLSPEEEIQLNEAIIHEDGSIAHESIGNPLKSVSVMLFGMDLNFEVVEFDQGQLTALAS